MRVAAQVVVRQQQEIDLLLREVRELRERSVVSSEMIGKSTAINQLRSSIERVAPTNSRVLIRGSSGTGKELCARVMHQTSLRKDGPFVVLNAAAMAPDRVEEEMFGTKSEGKAGEKRAKSMARNAKLQTMLLAFAPTRALLPDPRLPSARQPSFAPAASASRARSSRSRPPT